MTDLLRSGRVVPAGVLGRSEVVHARQRYEAGKPRDQQFLGAVGLPTAVPDHISLWGLLIKIRREFQQYANIRPVRLMPGIDSPLKNREPGSIDFIVVRENNEGEYSSLGGRAFEGTEHEFVVQESIFTRRGVDRILRYAFELDR